MRKDCYSPRRRCGLVYGTVHRRSGGPSRRRERLSGIHTSRAYNPMQYRGQRPRQGRSGSGRSKPARTPTARRPCPRPRRSSRVGKDVSRGSVVGMGPVMRAAGPWEARVVMHLAVQGHPCLPTASRRQAGRSTAAAPSQQHSHHHTTLPRLPRQPGICEETRPAASAPCPLASPIPPIARCSPALHIL